jgi:molybdopterin-guanine dinucleotide biosynthesis protein A
LPDSANVVVDISPGKGSLGGIFSGLSAMEGEWGLTVACDMPFINLQLFSYMLDLRQGFDAVVPVINGLPEPMHALYFRRCLTPIGHQIRCGNLKISGIFNGVKVRFVLEEEIDKMDPEHFSFFNINTQRDLERALVLVSQGL